MNATTTQKETTMSCLNCCFRTRKGTAVLHAGAARAAGSWEIYNGEKVAEYKVYRDIKLRGEYVATDGDNIMVLHCEDIPTHAHMLNLVTGEKVLLSWDLLANNVTPKV